MANFSRGCPGNPIKSLGDELRKPHLKQPHFPAMGAVLPESLAGIARATPKPLEVALRRVQCHSDGKLSRSYLAAQAIEPGPVYPTAIAVLHYQLIFLSKNPDYSIKKPKIAQKGVSPEEMGSQPKLLQIIFS